MSLESQAPNGTASATDAPQRDYRLRGRVPAFEEHRKVLTDRAISDAVAIERGYDSYLAHHAASEREWPGFGRKHAGVIVPIWGVDGKIAAYQLRLDDPPTNERTGKPEKKYLFPRGYKPCLDVVPRCRKSIDDPRVPLLICESPLKADSAASAWSGDCCIVSIAGVFGWRGSNAKGGVTALADWESVALKSREEGRTIFLAPDCDVATNHNVRNAVARLKAFLENKGATVKTIYLPVPADPKFKIGLDDWRAQNPTATFEDLLKLARDEVAPSGSSDIAPDYKSIKAEIERDFCVEEESSEIYSFKTGRLINDHKFKAVAGAPYRYWGLDSRGNRKIYSGAEAWLMDAARRTHRGFTLAPGQPQITADNKINLWKDWPVEPCEGDVSWWTELLDHAFVSAPDERRYFEQCCAWPFAHPEDPKLFIAIIIWSREHGVGKDLIGRCVAACYGAHARVFDNDGLRSRFNGRLAGALFGHAKEIAGSDRREDADKFKAWVTEPVIPFERKGKDAIELPNLCNWYLTSNHCDSTYIEDRERRYFIHESTAGRLDAALAARVAEQINRRPDGSPGPGVAALLWHFMHNVSFEGLRLEGRRA